MMFGIDEKVVKGSDRAGENNLFDLILSAYKLEIYVTYYLMGMGLLRVTPHVPYRRYFVSGLGLMIGGRRRTPS